MFLLVAACAAEPVGSVRSAIILGTETSEYPAVVGIDFRDFGGYFCSGSVIAPRVVLTAAHCVAGFGEGPESAHGKVYFGDHVVGPGANPDRTVLTSGVVAHRYYAGDTNVYWDIGIAILSEDANVEPMPLSSKDATAYVNEGDAVTVVAFGVAVAGDSDTGGRKRVASIPVRRVDPRYIQYSVNAELPRVCHGDSGGATLVLIDGVETLVAMPTDTDCFSYGSATLVGPYLSSFVVPVLDRWDGPCKLDGICTEDCRTPDPDCDDCAYNGRCGDNCPARDLDCPLDESGRFLAPCEQDTDCESLLCARSPDDPRIRYCSLPCDNSFGECADAGFACTESAPEGRADRLCLYPTPTPTAQGFPCTEDDQCRSGICHAQAGICAEPCSEAEACADDYNCVCYDNHGVNMNVCANPAEGLDVYCPVDPPVCPDGDDCDGGCSCNAAGGGSSSRGFVLLLLATIATATRRKWLRIGSN